VNGAGDGLFLHIPADAFTLAGFRAWAKSDELPEKLRVTFVDGEIYLEMPKEELTTHALVKTEVCGGLHILNRKRKLGLLCINGVLVTNEEAGVSNNPDAVLIRKKSIKSGRVRLVPSTSEDEQIVEIEGTPDWLLEIVSNSSVRKDTQRLHGAYHRAGVPEYWLIDARGEAIDFQILLWRKQGYVAAPSRDGWQKSRVFSREFRLTRRRDDMGLWEYTLRVRPA
jgi:Uma2 family endonuclease